ncbi:biotin/lipoyl-binding protein, partial [Sphingomonas sp. PL-96]|uniref:biotin/lipoyl-binding protein n=1 Tax=Sphingomonas sp. PL-96 TaxID=2887201 RepID=UPI001E2F22C7
MTIAARAAALAPVLALVAALSACSGHDEPETKPSTDTARAVTVAQVASRAMGGSLQASGLLVAFEEAAVTSELSGYRIAQVLVDEGDTVRVGQPLAILDPALLQSKIAQGRAQLAQAQAQAAQAQSEATRVKG